LQPKRPKKEKKEVSKEKKPEPKEAIITDEPSSPQIEEENKTVKDDTKPKGSYALADMEKATFDAVCGIMCLWEEVIRSTLETSTFESLHGGQFTNEPQLIERFSFECRKVIGCAFTTLRDWLKKLAPLFHPIRSKTKTNRDSLVHVFPHFASATCNYFAF